MDSLLGTQREFLLGCWLEDSKKHATNAAERRQYERNARLQITVWGPSTPDAMLFDYSNRQWSGLIRGYYMPRWEQFLSYLSSQPSGPGRFTGKNMDLAYNRPADEANDFYRGLSQWEQQWCNKTDSYPSSPAGDSVLIAAQLLAKWNSVRKLNYAKYDLRTLSAKKSRHHRK